ncbi:hypothetical protein FACS1894110_05380 [Spirochaetia bacterium]|nr:hypothetical protein FACS1894110_05380 [Spirochaetia bacterium]
MGRYKSILGIAAAVILILSVLAYTQLEIYQRTRPISPSQAVRANYFYALEKWLTKTGHPVRIDSHGSPFRIIPAKERSVYIQASLFDWQDAAPILIPWVEEGGSLLISIESSWYDEDETDFVEFLEAVGVQAEIWVPEDDETVILRDLDHYVITENNFDLDLRFSFSVIKDFGDTPLTLKDKQGIIRLVSIPLGNGSITVTGRPYFMYNDNLESEENARLSWQLTAANVQDEHPGVLFVRGRRAVKNLFGKLAERGNPLPPIVSVLVLVCIGFWMVIPGFGILRPENEQRARPIRDRFSAETRFLKKYHALEGYLEVYLREIKYKCRDRELDPRDKYLRDIYPLITEIENSLGEKKNLKHSEIIRILKILEKTMEHL